MLKYLLTVIFLLTFAFSSPAADNAAAFQGQGCMGSCTECHKIDKDEATKLLKADKFKATVKDIRMSPVKGIWEIEFTIEGKPKSGLVYIDFAKKYLINRAEFIPLEKLGEEPQQPPTPIIDISKIPLDKAILFGSAKASKKVIIFSDPDCPFCRTLHAEITKIIKDRPDIAFYVKMFPLPTHPEAYEKSKAILCGKKPSKLLEDAFANKTIPKAKSTCKTDELDDNLKLGEHLDIHGTPAIILPDGRMIPGYVPADALLNLIDNPSAAAKPEEKAAGKTETPAAAKPEEKAAGKTETPAAAKP